MLPNLKRLDFQAAALRQTAFLYRIKLVAYKHNDVAQLVFQHDKFTALTVLCNSTRDLFIPTLVIATLCMLKQFGAAKNSDAERRNFLLVMGG